MYTRPYFDFIIDRLNEPRKFIQIVFGPRQTGKTTLILQVLKKISIPSEYITADTATINADKWIAQQWVYSRPKYMLQAGKIPNHRYARWARRRSAGRGPASAHANLCSSGDKVALEV